MLSEIVDGSRTLEDVLDSFPQSPLPDQGRVIWEAGAYEAKSCIVSSTADSLEIYSSVMAACSTEKESYTFDNAFVVTGGQWDVLRNVLTASGVNVSDNQEVYVRREGQETREKCGFITKKGVSLWLGADNESRSIEQTLRTVFATQIRTIETPIEISRGILTRLEQQIAEEKNKDARSILFRRKDGLHTFITRQELLLSQVRGFAIHVFFNPRRSLLGNQSPGEGQASRQNTSTETVIFEEKKRHEKRIYFCTIKQYV